MLFFRGQKYHKSWRKATVFVYILDFIFYGVSRAKNNLHNKYIFDFVFDSLFEQDHILNLFNLGVYAKWWPKYAHISKRNWGPFYRKAFKWKKYGGTATSSYFATGKFLQYFYSVVVAKDHQKIRSRCLVHEFIFTYIF